ncbi:nuclear hormone receptor HR96 [Anopheles ziemanni]|uniref:nuclear hormone receptor HR96 n=1 Tax=Anopheles ziemanni TaxID=345580 RepID=UPI00265FFEBD|nr:nuclear hormone receptor HR96 [Anopheles ziemanni]
MTTVENEAAVPDGEPSMASSSGGGSKICSVCGDKALGYNFNAVTCESCKAFFRRNALSTKGFTCPFNEKCEITVVTRRFCQKCRLEKCFQIGMKKEYIMSEEDKVLKRKKIEQNRAKKRLSNGTLSEGAEVGPGEHETYGNNARPAAGVPTKIKREKSLEMFDSGDCWNNSSSSEYGVSNELLAGNGTTSNSLPPVTIESSAEDIVERIVKHPNQTITSLMKTPKEAVFIMSKIINSQCDALKLISHFITAPSDALQILSKIMNSPLDALTVFTQFMSSPTDALQLIGKVISSPGEVLQFMQQLMNQPEDAVQIMKKFMDSPAEALQMINRMMNHSDIVKTIKEAADTSQIDDDDQQRGDIVSIPTESHPPEESGPNQHQMIRSLIQESNPMPEQAVGKSSISAAASPSSTSNYEPSYGSLLDPLLSSTTTSYTHSHHLAGGIQPASPPSCSTDMLAEVFSTSTSSTFVGHDSPSPIVPAADELGIFQDIEAKPVLPNTLESVLMQAIKLEYEGYNSSPIGSSTGPQAQSHHHLQAPGNNSIELNDAERAKLNELIVANKALYAPVDDDLASLISDDCRIKSNQTQQDPQLLKVINLTAIAIRRLIKMSKKISAFKNMCQEDQLALLKGGCTEMMILRSAMQYDCDRATWRIPHSQEEMSNIRADVLKLAKGNVYQEHERFIRTFDKKWRSDENIILIMCAITLFTPDRPKTIHSDVIKLEQNSYYYLLRRYLESIYPGCEARSVFLKLMQKISELHRLNDEIISVYLNVNPAEVEPLLREIFDLKVR